MKNKTQSFDNVKKINVFFYPFFFLSQYIIFLDLKCLLLLQGVRQFLFDVKLIFVKKKNQKKNHIKYIELTSTKAKIKKIMFDFLH